MAHNIDAHRLKIQGSGYVMFFTKIHRGVKVFRKKCLGVPFFRVLLHFYKKSVLKFAWGGYYIYPATPPTSPPCVYLWHIISNSKNISTNSCCQLWFVPMFYQCFVNYICSRWFHLQKASFFFVPINLKLIDFWWNWKTAMCKQYIGQDNDHVDND